MNTLFEQTKELSHLVTEAVYYFRRQNFYRAYRLAMVITNRLQKYLTDLAEQDLQQEAEEVLPVLGMALEAMEQQDGTKLADIYEEGILSFLYRIQQTLFETSADILQDCWGSNRRILKKRYPDWYRKILESRDEVSDCYQVSWAKTGDLVLEMAGEQGTVRLNSQSDPWREALLFAESAVSKEYQEYLVMGFGLGYHLECMLKQPGCKKIVVLENDLYQLAIALSYRNLSHLLDNEKVTVCYCPDAVDYSGYLSDLTDDTKCVVWYPSIRTIQNTSLRETLENYQIELSSTENMEEELEDNFLANVAKQDQEISCLRDWFAGKTMILAAGGPSLDDNIELLKQRKTSDHILVCVGKVAAKLIREGLRPDYIVMIDGAAKTRWQINGIEDSGIPLIYLATAAAKVVEDYQGKRYVAYQEGFPAAEKYAEEKSYPLYQTGGSVSTFALDMGIRFGCSRIVCVGLDMGYPGNRTHASGVGADVADRKNLRRVEGIASEYVYTSRTLDIYRKWIEERIRGVQGVQIVNVSGGARIHGMEEGSLIEYM